MIATAAMTQTQIASFVKTALPIPWIFISSLFLQTMKLLIKI